ncbi:uncharacterized protein PAC_14417 [Phialocephala subalpina]|uniref:DNA2/NAM7 helicase-like C-terminal domain-containing protein n=1 Tax=Phialocephala subalpina TaxID=576137 RepID=A0A1L7XHJ9_9HELO|nr:uncharacterized protein PAC_14417 [Phialocephala subalpina]
MTVACLAKTGIKPMRLDTQYHADPDISAFFRSHAYNAAVNASRENWSLCDSLSARNFATHLFMANWVAGFLGKSPADCKVSVFVNVKDGQCVQVKSSTGLLNLQNLIAIAKVIKSLPPAGIALSGILVVTFFPRSVATIRSFLKSQGLKVRVEHIDSTSLNTSSDDNPVVIIDCPTLYTNNATRGGSLGDVKRNKKALLLPRALRIVVGHQDIGLRASFSEMGEGIGPNQGGRFWQAFIKQHRDFGMMKDMKIGEELLEYEAALVPDRYWMASKRGVDATGIFKELRAKKEAKEAKAAAIASVVEVDEENDPDPLGHSNHDRNEIPTTYRLEDRLENMNLGPDGLPLPDSVLPRAANWREVEKEREATGYTYSNKPNEKYGKDKQKLDRIKKSSSWR